MHIGNKAGTSASRAARVAAIGKATGLLAFIGCQTSGDSSAREPVGARRFDQSQFLEQTADASASVSIGDVNLDGHLDILLVKGRHWPLADPVLLGDGNGNFTSGGQLRAEADRSYSGVLADLDGDGDLDVVVSNDRPDPKLVYLNDGRGSFAVHSTFGLGEWPTRYVTVAELNGDGYADIVIANRYGERGGSSYVCFNEGASRFDGDCLDFSRGSATTITAADIDGDGRLDLVVPHRDGGLSRIYLNDESATFDRSVPFGPARGSIRAAVAGDMNEDGHMDLAVIDELSGPALFLGGADLTFGSARSLGSGEPTPYALVVADLDEDSHLDIIVGYVESRPIAFFGDGAGGFTPVEFGDDSGTAYGFATGDLNEDGYIDMAMARSDAPNIVYFGLPAD